MRAARLLRRAAVALAAGIALAAQAVPVHLFHASPEPYRFLARAPYPAGEYFALHCAAGCALKKNRVTMKKVVLDTHDGRQPGVVARSGKAPPSLFMVRGLPGLREGVVTTWYYDKGFQGGLPGTGQTWKASQVRRFDIGGKPLTVAGLYTNTKDELCAADPDCLGSMRVEWKVRFGEVERTLAVAETNAPELGTPLTVDDVVVWIGDLDGDGRPDLVLRPQYRGDYLDLQLFLSRDLAPGKPWRPAAQFYYWDPDNQGC